MQGLAFEPTAEQRRLVRAFSGFGVSQEAIAEHLSVDPKTLRKYFREEIDRGTTEANVKVAQSLFQMATQGRNVAAAIFWMKARGGWREKHDDLTGKDGKPVGPMVVSFRWADDADKPGAEAEGSVEAEQEVP